MCLGVGLLARDIQSIQFDFSEGGQYHDGTDESVQYLQKSALDWMDLETLMDACTAALEDIALMFENPKDAQAADPKKSVTKPPRSPRVISKGAASSSQRYGVVS
jgi:hypothetical protein